MTLEDAIAGFEAGAYPRLRALEGTRSRGVQRACEAITPDFPRRSLREFTLTTLIWEVYAVDPVSGCWIRRRPLLGLQETLGKAIVRT